MTLKNFDNTCAEMSTLNEIPLDHILSKLSTIRPSPILLDPDVLSTRVESPALSACAWISEAEVETMIEWAIRWSGVSIISLSPPQTPNRAHTGPVSLVVTTAAVPSSANHIAL